MESSQLDLNNDMDKEHMKTLSSCINSLLASGFATQFKAIKHGLKSLTTEKIYAPEEVKITNFYRFEGESDPADSAVLYAIETVSGEKGTLTDAYGAYSDPHVARFIKDVEDIEKREHKKDNEGGSAAQG
ncbi:MAG TPA: hypothetical protein VF868_04680 [Bacteroidia bacterium]|jgi:hypothetical protein